MFLTQPVWLSQADGQTERQNSRMEAYLRVFMNWEQNNWARLLLITEFAYNNSKNASTGHTLFELDCNYHQNSHDATKYLEPKRKATQKTSDSLGNFYVDETNVDGAPKATLERVFCI